MRSGFASTGRMQECAVQVGTACEVDAVCVDAVCVERRDDCRKVRRRMLSLHLFTVTYVITTLVVCLSVDHRNIWTCSLRAFVNLTSFFLHGL